MAGSKFSIRGILGINVKGFEAGLKKAQKSVKKFKKQTDKMGSAANKMAVPFIVGVLAIAKVAGDFQHSMARVKAVSGATVEEFKMLGDAAKEMGRTTQYSAVEASQGLIKLGMAGISASNSVKMLPNVLNLATAANIDLATSADIVGDAMVMFKMSASETIGITDDLATTVTSSNTDMEQLFETLKYGGSTAKTLGMSLKSTSMMIALFADASIKGSRAGTGFNNLIDGLVAGTKKGSAASKVFKEIGVSASEMTDKLRSGDITGFVTTFQNAMSKFGKDDQISLSKALFGKIGGKAFLGLINSSKERLEELTNAYSNNQGAAKKMADEGVGKFQKAMNTLKSTIMDLLIQLGESGVLKALTDFAKKLTEGVRYIAENKDAVLKFGKAIAGIIIVLKTAQIALVAFNGIVATNPYYIAAVAIIALGTALYAFMGNANKAKKAQKELNLEIMKGQDLVKSSKSIDDVMRSINTLNKRQLSSLKDRIKNQKHDEEDFSTALQSELLKRIDNDKTIQALQTKITETETGYQGDIIKSGLYNQIKHRKEALAEGLNEEYKSNQEREKELDRYLAVVDSKIKAAEANKPTDDSGRETATGITLKPKISSDGIKQEVAKLTDMDFTKNPIYINAKIRTDLDTVFAKIDEEAKVFNLPQADVAKRKIDAINAAMTNLIHNEGFTADSPVIQSLNTWKESLSENEEKTITFGEAASVMGSAMGQVGSSIQGAAGSWMQYASGILRTIPALISSIAAMGATELAANTATGVSRAGSEAAKGSGILAPILLAAAIATSLAAMVAIPKPKKYAKGGVFRGANIAEIGEYAGAKLDPEWVGKRSEMLGDIQKAVNESSGGTSQGYIIGGSVKIEGSDLIFAIEQQEKQDNIF